MHACGWVGASVCARARMCALACVRWWCGFEWMDSVIIPNPSPGPNHRVEGVKQGPTNASAIRPSPRDVGGAAPRARGGGGLGRELPRARGVGGGLGREGLTRVVVTEWRKSGEARCGSRQGCEDGGEEVEFGLVHAHAHAHAEKLFE